MGCSLPGTSLHGGALKLAKRMNAVMAAPLPARVKAVLWVLARRANDTTGQCWTSMSRLSADSGASVSACQRALRTLERLGYLRSIRHPRRVTHFVVLLRAVKSTAQGGQIDRLNRSLNPTRRKPRLPANVKRGPWPVPVMRSQYGRDTQNPLLSR